MISWVAIIIITIIKRVINLLSTVFFIILQYSDIYLSVYV